MCDAVKPHQPQSKTQQNAEHQLTVTDSSDYDRPPSSSGRRPSAGDCYRDDVDGSNRRSRYCGRQKCPDADDDESGQGRYNIEGRNDTDENAQLAKTVDRLSAIGVKNPRKPTASPSVSDDSCHQQFTQEPRMDVTTTTAATPTVAAEAGGNVVTSLIAGDSRSGQPLTVEDVYIEAMTLDAEIRLFRRALDSDDQDELRRIIGWCRDTLHRKLLHRSTEITRNTAAPAPANTTAALAVNGCRKPSVCLDSAKTIKNNNISVETSV